MADHRSLDGPHVDRRLAGGQVHHIREVFPRPLPEGRGGYDWVAIAGLIGCVVAVAAFWVGVGWGVHALGEWLG